MKTHGHKSNGNVDADEKEEIKKNQRIIDALLKREGEKLVQEYHSLTTQSSVTLYVVPCLSKWTWLTLRRRCFFSLKQSLEQSAGIQDAIVESEWIRNALFMGEKKKKAERQRKAID